MINTFDTFTFGYRMVCNATIMSVKVLGFCPKVTPNTTVEMHLIVSFWTENSRTSHGIFLEAECNSEINRYNYSSGSVSKDNLNISVSSGDFLSVKFSKSCSNERCFFNPGFSRKKGSLLTYLLVNNSIIGVNHTSLLLSALINKNGRLH